MSCATRINRNVLWGEIVQRVSGPFVHYQNRVLHSYYELLVPDKGQLCDKTTKLDLELAVNQQVILSNTLTIHPVAPGS